MRREPMLTKEQAMQLVADELKGRSKPGMDLVVVEDLTIERDFGWVFYYTATQCIESDQPGVRRRRLRGNGPKIVNKYTGKIESCPTYRRVADLIADYEWRWAAELAREDPEDQDRGRE